MGKYDAVVLYDAPNAEAMSETLLSYASLGLGRTESLRGFTPEEMIEMVNSLP